MLVWVSASVCAHSMPSSRTRERPEPGAATGKERAMAGDKASAPCGKFQANIFNKSKCQNCFKARAVHPSSELELERARPVYGGWLCLAPAGTDFDNPMQRSRKWQRRFFLLFEHGRLSYALDELPSTLPQGTVDMNACTDVSEAETRTGQKNSLCIVTPEQEVFIRGDSKEITNGWSEQLCVYARTNRQNQKKKRKVELLSNQEPSPAKIAASDASFPSWNGDSVPQISGPDIQGGPDPDTSVQGSVWTSSDFTPSTPDPSSPDAPPHSTPGEEQERSSDDPVKLHLLLDDHITRDGDATPGRTGRTETRTVKREKLPSCGDTAQLRPPTPQRRAKSLDRHTSDTVMTPDLLNFKKGWLMKLEEDEWKKFWFVLSADRLRYYKDSLAEESADLEGEINLSRCFSVSEYEVQRNYGFQIHLTDTIVTLSAMTAGIRRNWIQSLMKKVCPPGAPDVASVPPLQVLPLPKPDITQDRNPPSPAKTVAEKRREGHYRTFDWAEFKPEAQTAREEQEEFRPPSSLELGDHERRKRREERRRRYEGMLGVSLQPQAGAPSTTPDAPAGSGEMEEFWKRVEQSRPRPERTVLLGGAEAEKLLQSYRGKVEDLKLQLAESERRRLALEAELSTEHGGGKQGTSLDKHDAQRVIQERLEPPSLLLLEDALSLDVTDGHLGEPDRPDRADVEESMLKVLCGEVERLLTENEALNQRNQEMVNQLTEADREIDRLKAECPPAKEEGKEGASDHLQLLERELTCREQELMEAQALISRLEAQLQEEKPTAGDETEGGTEGELFVQEQSELNSELREEETSSSEEEEHKEERSVTDEEKLQLVMESLMAKARAELEILDALDQVLYESSSPPGQEVNFWSLLLDRVKDCGSKDPAAVLLRETAECVVLEKQLLLQVGSDLTRPGLVGVGEGPGGDLQQLRADTLSRIALLQHASSTGSSMLLSLQPTADRLHQLLLPERVRPQVGAGAEEALRLLLSRLEQEGGTCSCCTELAQENQQLQARLQEASAEGAGEREQQEALRARVEELQEQKEELSERLQSVQEEHERRTDKMKAACDRSFTLVEEKHLMEVEELQRLHQLELQRLLEERDRLLEEEIAATATAIKAITKSHSEQLHKLQQRCECVSGDTRAEDVHRLLREELDSCRRELDVLSQQFSMRCLENEHLIQALDAERKALSQCQQENQDLQGKNQELSAHLTAEITPPLGAEGDTYELQITLRVKESELQCLKQEVRTLKDELQSALQEKRSTNRKFKEMYTELSELRVAAEREAEELRENLRLARLALEQS